MKRSNDALYNSSNDGMKRMRMNNNFMPPRMQSTNTAFFGDSFDGGYPAGYNDYGDSYGSGYAADTGEFGSAQQMGYNAQSGGGQYVQDQQQEMEYYGGGGAMGQANVGEFGMGGSYGSGFGYQGEDAGDNFGFQSGNYSVGGPTRMGMQRNNGSGNMMVMGGADMGNGMGLETGAMGGMMGNNVGMMGNGGFQFMGGSMSVGNMGGQMNMAATGGLAPGSENYFDFRTIYMGNLPQGVRLEEILNYVNHGPLEQVRIMEEKKCAFITFVDSSSALAFATENNAGGPNERTGSVSSPIMIQGNQIKIGWGKPSKCPPQIAEAIRNGATRTVFIGSVDESVTEEWLFNEFSMFGPVDKCRVIPQKNIAFVHMASIATAMKAIEVLSQDPRFAGKRVNYGKDRCGTMGQQVPTVVPAVAPAVLPAVAVTPTGMETGRTVYIGSIGTDATIKDICDGKRVKVAWGKTMAPLPVAISNAIVLENATRTVYIGLPPNRDGTGAVADASQNPLALTLLADDRLRMALSEFGEIENINVIPAKGIAFVSFTDIASAIRAVDSANTSTGLKSRFPDYAICK
ncbi:hypothetical protein HK405_011783, partial [Cladochytrium tenue]